MAIRGGGGATVMVIVHTSLRCCVSTAVHVTVFAPTANRDPLDGEHITDTGGAPPTTVGSAKCTSTGWPSCDCAAGTDGHEIRGGSIEGPVGWWLHRATSSAPERTARTMRFLPPKVNRNSVPSVAEMGQLPRGSMRHR